MFRSGIPGGNFSCSEESFGGKCRVSNYYSSLNETSIGQTSDQFVHGVYRYQKNYVRGHFNIITYLFRKNVNATAK